MRELSEEDEVFDDEEDELAAQLPNFGEKGLFDFLIKFILKQKDAAGRGRGALFRSSSCFFGCFKTTRPWLLRLDITRWPRILIVR